MLSIAHTLISLPYAFWLEHPLAIFLAAMATHFLADTLLHWNIYPDPKRPYPVLAVASDVLGGVAVAWLLLGDAFLTLPVLVAIAGGNAPDVLHGLWELLPAKQRRQGPRWFKASFDWHDKLQVETTNVAAGLVSQVIAVGLALWLIS